jgi:hypothetical protein
VLSGKPAPRRGRMTYLTAPKSSQVRSFVLIFDTGFGLVHRKVLKSCLKIGHISPDIQGEQLGLFTSSSVYCCSHSPVLAVASVHCTYVLISCTTSSIDALFAFMLLAPGTSIHFGFEQISLCLTSFVWVCGLCPSSGIRKKKKKAQSFGNWICFHLQVSEVRQSVGPLRKC